MKTRYNLCPECGQPRLRKGQKRKSHDDYRHAKGCPNDDWESVKRELREAAQDAIRRGQFSLKPSRRRKSLASEVRAAGVAD